MSDPSLHDTAIDFTPVGTPAPWRLREAAGWTAIAGLAAGGTWFAVAFACRLLPHSIPFDTNLQRDRPEAVALLAGGGGMVGFLVGVVAGYLYGRPGARVRSGLAWGVGLAVMSSLGGGLVPLAVTAPKPLTPEAATALVWVVVGAVVGLVGYTHSRLPVGASPLGPDDRPTWHPAGAAGWGLTIGGLAAAAWYAELAVLRLPPNRIELGTLVRGSESQLAVGAALSGGVIGLVAGFAARLLLGRPSRPTAGLVRGLGFAVVGAAGGGLFPLVVSATAGQLPAEVSSALTWGVVCGLAAVVAYTGTRWPQPQPLPAIDTDNQRASDRETVVVRSGVRLGAGPGGRSEAVRMAADPPGRAGDEPPAVVTPGWDPEPVTATQTVVRPTPPEVLPTTRPTTSGAIVRVAPVLMVTVACLLAVGLSTPSPAGWPMLGVGLLGLAASWALVGQERRIRDRMALS